MLYLDLEQFFFLGKQLLGIQDMDDQVERFIRRTPKILIAYFITNVTIYIPIL